FTGSIEEAEKDKQLADKLRAEWPGILAWAVRGCLDWQRHGLGEPEEVKAATDAYQAEQDTLGAFIRACCLVHAEARVTAGKLLEAYQRWSGDKDVTQRALAPRLTAKGFTNKPGTGGYVFWHGIKLADGVDLS